MYGVLVRPAGDGDGESLQPRLGPESAMEHRACGSCSLEMAVAVSHPCWAAEIEGQVEALFGVGPRGTAWLLHSGRLTPRQIASHGPVWLSRMLRERGPLWNVVPVGSVAETWLIRLGAEVEPQLIEIRGLHFRRFSLPTSLLS